MTKKDLISGVVVILCLRMGALADTLVLRDGRFLIGDVTETEQGYQIQVRGKGQSLIPKADVTRWMKDPRPGKPDVPAGGAVPAKPDAPGGETMPAKPAPAAPVIGASAKKRALDPAVIEQIVSSAWDALSLGDVKGARDGFSDVLVVDEKNVRAARGLGAVYLKLGDFDKARVNLEKSCGGKPAGERALAINLASAHLHMKTWARAMKFVKEYLAGLPDVTRDEPAINALAIILNQAPVHAQNSSEWQEGYQLYNTCNNKLEASRPGEARWGIEWTTERQAKQKRTQLSEALREVSDLDARLGGNEQDQANARSRIARLSMMPPKVRDRLAIRSAEDQLQLLATEHGAIEGQLQAAQARVQRPAYPNDIALLPLGENPDTSPGNAPPEKPQIARVAVPDVANQGSHEPGPVSVRRPLPRTATGGDSATDHPPVDIPPVAVAPVPVEIPVPVEPPAPKVPRVRQTMKYAVAFPISDTMLVTASSVVSGASEVSLQSRDGTAIPAEVVREDPASGLALVRSKQRMGVSMLIADQFAGGAIIGVGFPDVSLFDPVATAMSGSAPRPADGWKVRLTKNPRLPGAPLISNNMVVGVCLANRDDAPTECPAATLEQLRQFVGSDARPSKPAGNPMTCVFQIVAVRQFRE